MNDWNILGIEETNDLRKVKRAYAEKSKLYHPETHPEEFQQLHNAYKRIAGALRRKQDIPENVQIGKPAEVQEAEEKLAATMQKHFLQKLFDTTFRKKRLEPIRDIPQDDAFLKLVEEAAKNFEARHTDKRDPEQVAKVEAILKHDKKPKLLEYFQWALYNEFYTSDWRKFFIRQDFLERQYEPEFINGMAEILKNRLLEIKRAKKGAYASAVLIYFVIVYGAIFDWISHLHFKEHIYKKDLFESLLEAFQLDGHKLYSYQQLEESAELMGERYAFFLYRNILEELDATDPDKEKIKGLLIEGFQRENTSRLLELLYYEPKEGGYEVQPGVFRLQNKLVCSKVFFDLLAYLISSNRKNIALFKDVLAQVCEMEWDGGIQEELDIIRLLLMEG